QSLKPKTQPKGLLTSRLPEDYQARRLKQTLRIFDCGRLPSGEDISDFAIQPAIPTGLESLPAPEPELEWYATRDEFLFALAGDALFLMPNLCFYLASAKWFDPDYKLAHLGYDFRFGLRNYYADDLTPDADPTTQFTGQSYENSYEAVQTHINMPDARVLRGD